jgi:hypothetical protein
MEKLQDAIPSLTYLIIEYYDGLPECEKEELKKCFVKQLSLENIGLLRESKEFLKWFSVLFHIIPTQAEAYFIKARTYFCSDKMISVLLELIQNPKEYMAVCMNLLQLFDKAIDVTAKKDDWVVFIFDIEEILAQMAWWLEILPINDSNVQQLFLPVLERVKIKCNILIHSMSK